MAGNMGLITTLLWLGVASAQAQTPTQPQTQAPQADTAQPPPAPPPILIPVQKHEATPILGRQVLDGKGQAAGRIVDVLVDADGQTRAIIVDIGGFLGMGQRRVAVAWSALRFDILSGTITVPLSTTEMAAAPEYKGAGATVVAPADPAPAPVAPPLPVPPTTTE